MTLIVYKDGVLAADTCATREGTRERFHKLNVIEKPRTQGVYGYAGSTDAIGVHRLYISGEVDTLPRPLDYECLAVLRVRDTGHKSVSTACGMDSATSDSIMVAVGDDMFEVIGDHTAAVAAIAINSVRPEFDAVDIVRAVAEVCSSCDIKYGIDYVDTTNEVWRVKNV